jgi:hypothetical protein
MAADSAVTNEGVKVTLSEQLPPATTPPLQVLPLRVKSALFAPVMLMLVNVKLALPLFVSRTD